MKTNGQNYLGLFYQIVSVNKFKRIQEVYKMYIDIGWKTNRVSQVIKQAQ